MTTERDEWQDSLEWTEERLAAGEAVPVAPLVAGAAERWRDLPDEALEEATVALVRLARVVERAARLHSPDPEEPLPEEGEADDEEAAGPFAPPDELLDRMAALEEFQEVARVLKEYQARARRRFTRGAAGSPRPAAAEPPSLSTHELVAAFEEVWRRAGERRRRVDREPFTVQESMGRIVAVLADGPRTFGDLFPSEAGRLEVIITFLALLELVRAGRVLARQESPMAPIRLELLPGGEAA